MNEYFKKIKILFYINKFIYTEHQGKSSSTIIFLSLNWWELNKI